MGSLDGVEVVSYRHINGFESFLAMGLVANSNDGLEVLFDDPFAERL